MKQSACLSNTTWRQLPGISSNVGIKIRTGTVGFSRLNSTIQTYKLADDVKSANIVSAELLDAFHGLFTGRSRGTTGDDTPSEISELFNSILGSLGGGRQIIDMAPVIVASHFASGPLLYGSHHAGAARNTMSLHSLVAKVLFWSSLPVGETLATAIEGGPSSGNVSNGVQLSHHGGQATYSLATSVHELVIGKGTIISYGMLGGLVLLSCFGALFFSLGWTSGLSDTPALSSYPDLDGLKHLDFGNIRDTEKDGRDVTVDKDLVSGVVTLRNEHGGYNTA
jgi:hypothetical protein